MIRTISLGAMLGWVAGAVVLGEDGGVEWRDYIKASNSEAYDRFGGSGGIALAGDTLVVGATGEDGSSKGVNGDQGNGLDPSPRNAQEGLEAGAAYVFVRYGAGWSQQAYLKSADTDRYDAFGKGVAVSGDTVVVSSPGVEGREGGRPFRGAVYVFVREGKDWQEQARVTVPAGPGVDVFGTSVSICGETLVVGASGESGSPAAGAEDGEGPLMAGAVYVFVREGGKWRQQARLEGSNAGYRGHFGAAVAVSGGTIVVGATGDGVVAGGVDADPADDSLNGAGAAYIFEREGESWRQAAYLKPAEPRDFDAFGGAVAVAGERVVVGAVGGGKKVDDEAPGVAHVFAREGGKWVAETVLSRPGAKGREEFGAAVAVSGERVVIGAPLAAEGPGGDGETTGAAWLFTKAGGKWDAGVRLVEPGAAHGDDFGAAVAVSAGTVAVGAPGERGFGRGVNGERDTAGGGSPQSGAAFVYVVAGDGESAADGAQEAGGGLEESMFGYWGIDTDAMTEMIRGYAAMMLDMGGIREGHKDRAEKEKEQFAKIKAEFDRMAMEIKRGEIIHHIYPGKPERRTYRVLAVDEAAGRLDLEVSAPDAEPVKHGFTLDGDSLTMEGGEDEGAMVFKRIDEAGFKARLKAAAEEE